MRHKINFIDLLTATMALTFSEFFMFDKIFLSAQVKRSVIISNKHGIYELPYELPNDLRLRKTPDITKSENIRKI